MKKCFALSLCASMVFFSSFSSAETNPHKTKLDNGLTVIINEMPASPMVALYAWVNTGAATEGKYLGSGISHLIEHMLFKGTSRRPPGAIADEARAMGGEINASTGYDNTVFTLSIPKENFAKGLDLISDMVQNPSFDPKELELEREVVLKELRMNNDRPGRKLDELVYDSVYLVHPYKHPIIGHEQIYKKLTREDLVDHYQRNYVPNNMVFSVAGGVKAEDILPQIQKSFENFQMRPLSGRALPMEPEQIFSRRVELAYPTDLTRMTMAYEGVPLLDNDLYALDVLTMALGSGASSRFYQELHEKKRLVEEIGAGNNTPVDRGFVEINCLIKDKDPDVVILAVKALVEEVKKDGLKSNELAKIKRQVMADNIYARQTAEGMAYRAAMEEGFTGDASFSEKYLKGVEGVTNEDIKRVAREYLQDKRLTVVILKPKSAEMAAAAMLVSTPSMIEKLVLPNGLTLLLQEDHSLPIVSLEAVLNGGLRQESPELSGLSGLTGMVWEKGLKGKSFEQISSDVESLGGSFSSTSGFNSVVISLGFLSQDLPVALNYLEDAFLYPTFPEEEIVKEKDEMLTAIAARKDSIVQTSLKEMRETLFLTHPFRFDSLGTEGTLKKISRSDVVNYYERFLAPGNMVIAVVGDIDAAKVKGELIGRFGGMKPRPVTLMTAQEDPPKEQKVKEISMVKEQALVMCGFQAPSIHDKDKYAFEVAVNILSSSLSGRMFKRIREELGKAYNLSGSYSPGVDMGMAMFFTLTTEESIAKVRQIMREEISKLRDELVTDQELADSKTYLKSELARSLETGSSRALMSSIDELLGLGYDNYQHFQEHVAAVTKENIRDVVRKYLDPQHGVVVVTHSRVK